MTINVGLIEEISLVDDSEDEMSLVSGHGRVTFRADTPGLRAAFRALARGDRTDVDLTSMVFAMDGLGALTLFQHYLTQCIRRGFAQYAVWSEDVELACLRVTFPDYPFALPPIEPDARYRLSRFAYCRRDDGGMLLESPLQRLVMTLKDWRALALPSIFATPRTYAEAAGALPALGSVELGELMQMLLALEALSACCESSSGTVEDGNLALRHWEFHDLLFHTRSRIGRHNNGFGATFRHVGAVPPAPAVAPARHGKRIELCRPELHDVPGAMTLWEAIESRHSIRTYGRDPISVRELGEFLFRVARIKATGDYEIRADDGRVVETLQLSQRPYPGGGAIYELELYLSVDRCQGLSPGFYHYDPLHHQLSLLRDMDTEAGLLLRYAMLSAAISSPPQVLITIASRFPRMAWKYESIAYAATLKNVGVLYQTMYLVATGMGLAPCALGSGNSDLFALLAGTDYYTESSVGEFMLGSAPDDHSGSDLPNPIRYLPNSHLG